MLALVILTAVTVSKKLQGYILKYCFKQYFSRMAPTRTHVTARKTMVSTFTAVKMRNLRTYMYGPT
jgi:hypothetical protein